MSSSYEKVVKLACKPKAAAPKSKYMDPIIAATWSEDGAVHDVCKALSPRFKEPNAIVVFKAVIVLHTMIRNGATDNVLSYLSSSEILRLRNISAGHWEGYAAPQNLQNYATYLDTRIRAYRDLKHDAIRVQSESNRDMRNSMAIEEGRVEAGEKVYKSSTRRRFGGGRKEPVDDIPSSSHQRSKTISGRKLRVMTVEKGLLRETKTVQKMIDALTECRFYLDDLEDELNITALRMLVKDLLILFQACNEGVINVLEHYFEMSSIDAKEALSIYRHFCKETERVVEYLSVAKKLQNLLNVPIPNLRHAPVSLAGSLEEYLNDPNFEQNRIEYKTQKDAADKAAKSGLKPTTVKPADKPPSPKPFVNPQSQSSSSSTSTPSKPANQTMIDFFTAIEEEQPQMFNPQTNSPTSNYFQQQATYNPFSQQQMLSGAAFGQTSQMPTQVTGMFQPSQHTNPFGLQQQPPQQFEANFLQAQPSGFLQPQGTGAPNPFRQSMLVPNATNMPSFSGVGAGLQAQAAGAPTNPFPVQPQQTGSTFLSQAVAPNPFGQNPFPGQSQSTNPFPNTVQGHSSNLFGGQQTQSPLSQAGSSNFFISGPFPPPPTSTSSYAVPAAQLAPTFGSAANAATSVSPPRPASAPLRANSVGETQHPVKSHQTGSRNPFGVPVTPAPPVPKVPTLMELAMGFGNNHNTSANAQQQPTQTGAFFSSLSGFNPGASGQSSVSNVVSSFATDNDKKPSRANTMPLMDLDTGATSSTTTGSTLSSSYFSSVSPQTTATSASTAPNGFGSTFSSGANPSISISSAGGAQPLQSQHTGFGGIKAFKPSSSFGAALLESLPSIPQSPNVSPNASSIALNASLNSAGSFPASNTAPSFSGLTTGTGLRPHATGVAGAANPFRASMFTQGNNPTGSAASAFGGFGGFGGSTSEHSSSLTSLGNAPTGFVGNGSHSTGVSMFGGVDANRGQQQQNGHTSLI